MSEDQFSHHTTKSNRIQHPVHHRQYMVESQQQLKFPINDLTAKINC